MQVPKGMGLDVRRDKRSLLACHNFTSSYLVIISALHTYVPERRECPFVTFDHGNMKLVYLSRMFRVVESSTRCFVDVRFKLLNCSDLHSFIK